MALSFLRGELENFLNPPRVMGGIQEQSRRDKLAREFSHERMRTTPGHPSYANERIQDMKTDYLANAGIPLVSDAAGLALDADMYANNPELRTLGNFAMSGLGLLPFVPSAVGAMKRADIDALRAEANANRGIIDDYRGVHTAPVPEGRNSIDDLTDIYPDDIYNQRVSGQYYGMGDQSDKYSSKIIASMRGKPDADVTIYRAVPKGVKDIHPGDWVTIDPNYAKGHGDAWVDDGKFDIIKRTVKARELVTDGNSMHEWGWSPKAHE